MYQVGIDESLCKRPLFQTGEAFKNMQIGVTDAHAPESSKTSAHAAAQEQRTNATKDHSTPTPMASEKKAEPTASKKATPETHVKSDKRPPSGKAQSTAESAQRPKSVKKKSEAVSTGLPSVRHQEVSAWMREN